MSFLLPVFEAMEESAFGSYIQSTIWAALIVQVIHITAVALFVGAILVVDLRLLSHGPTKIPVSYLARETQPYLLWSFAVLFVTGVPQLAALAVKYYYSPFFWWKLEAMAFAVVLTYWMRRKIASTDDVEGIFWLRVAAIASLGLWTSVIIAGRLNGLFS
jgi:hypothetical protein